MSDVPTMRGGAVRGAFMCPNCPRSADLQSPARLPAQSPARVHGLSEPFAQPARTRRALSAHPACGVEVYGVWPWRMRFERPKPKDHQFLHLGEDFCMGQRINPRYTYCYKEEDRGPTPKPRNAPAGR
eukprot:1625489-Alexandrium_andersonii.AAC.1